jgi:hypothetical protein
MEGNHYGRKIKEARKEEIKVVEIVNNLTHPCLTCGKAEIDIVHMECGHCSVCHLCYQPKCAICYHTNQFSKQFGYDDNGYLQCFDLS